MASCNYALAFLAAACAGVLISFQISAESAAKNIFKGGTYHTAVIAFGSAFLILVAYGLWNGLKITPALSELSSLRGFEVWGGVTRLLYLVMVVFACQKVGIAKATCVVVAAQILSAAAFQAHEIFGAQPIAWSWEKTLGAILIISGVVFTMRQ